MTPFAGAITDIAGLRVGHYTDARRPTGCTVLLCEHGVMAGVDVRGAAPGTRETDLLSPTNVVERIHALLLTGGSAFGLDAAGGVMKWLDERGHGIAVGSARVPIVPAAVLFDLWLDTPEGVRPDAAAGYAACEAASSDAPAQGSVGAGTGATVGKIFGLEHAMKGGIGTASLQVRGVRVGALIAVNAAGDVRNPSNGRIVAGSREGGSLRGITERFAAGELPEKFVMGANTTIGIVATDAALTKAEATRLATMAHDGLARTIDPVHTPTDGDTLFALATGTASRRLPLTVLGALAAEVTARAVLNAVAHATGLPGLPAAEPAGF